MKTTRNIRISENTKNRLNKTIGNSGCKMSYDQVVNHLLNIHDDISIPMKEMYEDQYISVQEIMDNMRKGGVVIKTDEEYDEDYNSYITRKLGK